MLPRWHSGKNPSANAGDLGDAGLIPGLGRSSGGENGNPLQYLHPLDTALTSTFINANAYSLEGNL